ncbi:hypothetical protein ACWGCW_30760 [Streptomyces sp. NPDC054933]
MTEMTTDRPTRLWNQMALLAPGLAVAGIVMFFVTNSLMDSHGAQAQKACHSLPVAGSAFVSAYASVLLSVAAMVTCVVVCRTAGRRGWKVTASPQGVLAVVACCLAGFALCFQAIMLYAVYDEAGSHWACEGAAALHGVLTVLR